MRAFKKVLAVLMACLFVFTSVQIMASAEDEQLQNSTGVVIVEDAVPEDTVIAENASEDAAIAEDVSEDAGIVEDILVAAQTDSPGLIIGRILGLIVFSPFLLIDLIIWVFSGFNVHIFYSWLFD